jgi:hypothetical protein
MLGYVRIFAAGWAQFGHSPRFLKKKKFSLQTANPLISFGGAEGDRTPNLLNAM